MAKTDTIRMGPGTPWLCRDGRWMLVAEMDDLHIQRCIALILCRNDGWRSHFMPILLAELEKRKQEERPF